MAEWKKKDKASLFQVGEKVREMSHSFIEREANEIFNKLKMLQKMGVLKDAQKLAKFFSERNQWKDIPNVDKFDHLHEELIEMSQHLRYKSEEERRKFVAENPEIFKDGIGDLFFGICRLANQLGVDVEEALNVVKNNILNKCNHRDPENNNVRK